VHLKRVVRRDGKLFIKHFVIIDAIDGSKTYYEELKGIKKILVWLYSGLVGWLAFMCCMVGLLLT